MKSMPRILPLVGVAIGGVLAINALAGARDLPALLSGAQAFAENAAKTVTPAKAKAAKPDPKGDPATAKAPAPGETGALTGEAMNAAATGLPPPTISPRAVCAPTAAELAKEAGLSPAELQVLQNLGERRGQLDKRENDLSTQTALMAAAEAKAALAEAVAAGLLQEVAVAGWARPAYLLPGTPVPRRLAHPPVLLSPFDSLIWSRERTERLFGFRYRLEMFVPKAKREYGYYVLPLLVGDELVGRAEPRFDRKTGELELLGAWGDTSRLDDALADLGAWLGAAR